MPNPNFPPADDAGLKALTTTHPGQSALIAFWGNLKEGYDLFEKTMPPARQDRADGAYAFPPSSS